MYLVAQRVHSPRGNFGTNAVMYRHAAAITPINWENPDLGLIASQYPGERVAQHVGVAPGGNAVVCYLDVAARDESPRSQISAALDELSTRIGIGTRFAELHGPVTAEFRITMGASDEAPVRFAELREAMLSLFDHQHELVQPTSRQPLTIKVEMDDQRWRFSLEPRDRSRVPALVTSITVALDVANDFRTIHGELYPHVSEWVTGLSREQILELGGVRFVGQINRQWPE